MQEFDISPPNVCSSAPAVIGGEPLKRRLNIGQFRPEGKCRPDES